MRIQKFEDVKSWQEAKHLYIEILEIFGKSSNYSYKDQLLRATLSVSNNIAEGFDRGSDKELRQFLIIARGSCAEVRSMLHIAQEVGYLEKDTYAELEQRTLLISKLLTGFIKKLTTEDRRLETS